jgi:hypothetical protein
MPPRFFQAMGRRLKSREKKGRMISTRPRKAPLFSDFEKHTLQAVMCFNLFHAAYVVSNQFLKSDHSLSRWLSYYTPRVKNFL